MKKRKRTGWIAGVLLALRRWDPIPAEDMPNSIVETAVAQAVRQRQGLHRVASALAFESHKSPGCFDMPRPNGVQ